MANTRKDDVKDTNLKDLKEQVLLTESEFERRQRLKAKERINRVTRVFGVFTILLLAFAGIFEPFFELSFFGRLFTPTEHDYGWAIFSADGVMDELIIDTERILIEGRLFDDWLNFQNTWLAKTGLTVLFIMSFILLVYFLTYTIVDLVDVVKEFIATGKEITKDLSGNVKDTMDIPTKEKTPKKKKKSLFDKTEDDVTDSTPTVKKERRREKTESFEGLTPEQLDDLLSGKPMEEVLNVESAETKDLF